MEKLMAVITRWEDAERVLERTQFLAEQLHTKFSVFRPVHGQLSEMEKYIGLDDFEALRDQIINEERRLLAEFCLGKTEDFHTEWCERVHEAVAREATQRGVGLVVIAASHQGVLANLIHRADDWHLLREVPCPALMLPETLSTPDKVVVALGDVDEGSEQQLLAERILDNASAFARLFEVPLTAITVMPDPALIYANLVSVPFDTRFQERAKKGARENLENFIARTGVSVDHISIEAGRVEDVVSQAAEGGLLVIGSAANKGIKGLFLGNTAERILQHMKTEMLVVN